MLFERPAKVSGFNRYMLPGVAHKTDQRSMLFGYPQQFVTGPVRQQSPFVNGNNGVLKLRSFLRSQQKRFDCLYLPLWDLTLERLDLIAGWKAQGKGLRQIARELNSLNIRTPRGAHWYACTVRAQLRAAS